jgi:hypothetical protein
MNPLNDGGVSDAGADACIGPLGTSAGDPIMRVCFNYTPCVHGSTLFNLGESDNACDDRGPVVQFTCPPTGHFNVMTAPYLSGQAFECRTTIVDRTGPRDS